MKALIHALLTLTFLPLSTNLSAYPEIPFCPAGGAPGWMNYIDYKRNQKRWQNNNYPVYSPATTYTGNYPLSNIAPLNNKNISTHFNNTANGYSVPKYSGYPYNNQPYYYRNHFISPVYQTR